MIHRELNLKRLDSFEEHNTQVDKSLEIVSRAKVYDLTTNNAYITTSFLTSSLSMNGITLPSCSFSCQSLCMRVCR